MSSQTRVRCPEVDELSCVPETQQSQEAAGVEELVVGVEDPLEIQNRVTLGWILWRYRTG